MAVSRTTLSQAHAGAEKNGGRHGLLRGLMLWIVSVVWGVAIVHSTGHGDNWGSKIWAASVCVSGLV